MQRYSPFTLPIVQDTDPPQGCRLTGGFLDSIFELYQLGQVMGSKELKPILIDGIFLYELAALREAARKIPGEHYRAREFWAMLGGRRSEMCNAEKFKLQCLRDTIPRIVLGQEDYGVKELAEGVVDSIKECRERLGIKGLPRQPAIWWKANYSEIKLEVEEQALQSQLSALRF